MPTQIDGTGPNGDGTAPATFGAGVRIAVVESADENSLFHGLDRNDTRRRCGRRGRRDLLRLLGLLREDLRLDLEAEDVEGVADGFGR